MSDEPQELSEEQKQQNAALLVKICKAEIFVCFFGSIFLLGKPQFTDWVLIDAASDKYLGYSLVAMIISSIYLIKMLKDANKSK